LPGGERTFTSEQVRPAWRTNKNGSMEATDPFTRVRRSRVHAGQSVLMNDIDDRASIVVDQQVVTIVTTQPA
jgi:hypothetical protein